MKIIKFVAFLIPAALLLLALITGFALLMTLFAASFLVLLISFIWTAFGLRGISGEIEEITDTHQAGEWFRERTTVTNSSWLPKVLAQVEEVSDLPGHHNAAFFNLGPRGSYSWKTEVYCSRRGVFNLGRLKATFAGPFGFPSSSSSFGPLRSLFVFPATLELPHFQILSRNDVGHGSSRWLSSELGPDASRVREYAVGDTLHHIHWRSTAHARTLMVKEFDADHSSYAMKNIWVVLDLNAGAQVDDENGGTEEAGVTIAASLIKKYIDNEKDVGLIISSQSPEIFPPRTGAQHYWDMMEALTLVKPGGEMSLDRLLATKSDLFGDGPVVIVVTPAPSDRLVATLRQIRGRGAVIVPIILNYTHPGLKGSDMPGAAGFATSGFQVYFVRQGEMIDRALDSRAYIPAARNTTDII